MAREIIDLSALNLSVAKRGRKSTVTPDDIADAQALEVGQGIHIEEASESGNAYSAYINEALAKDATKTEDVIRNAWQSRFRQRCIALAKASGVAMTTVFTTDGECYFARKA